MPAIEPLTEEQFLATYAGPKRSRYERAFRSLEQWPLERRDGYVSAFVKAEKMDPGAKKNPDPRMIQCRNARYNVVVGRYMKVIEKKLYDLTSPLGTRLVAKGLNSRDRGEMLASKLEAFNRPVIYSIDGSRWDKHIDHRVLDVEHSFYKHLVHDPEFARALSWQRTNKTRTSGGVRYVSRGKRMSGDMNTALGNCLLMCLMVRDAMRRLGLNKWDCFDDGDDCLIIVESSEEWRLRGLSGVFLDYGQEIKLENRSTAIEGVVFCQSRPIRVGGKWRFVRDWRKCLSSDTSGVKHWGDGNMVAPAMMTTIGTANLAMYAGVPILQAHALACIRNGNGKMRTDLVELHECVQRYKTELGPDWQNRLPVAQRVDPEARETFERAFGVSPDEQLAIEAILDSWKIDDYTPVVYQHPEWDSQWVDNTHLDNLAPEI